MATNLFFQVADNLRPAAQTIVGETVKHLSGLVLENAPRDTGFMGDSSYYVTPAGETNYGEAEPTHKGSYLLPMVEPENDTQGVVGVAANYAEFVELGHHVHNSDTYVQPQPFFYPAMEQAEAVFNEHASAFETLLGA